MVIGAFREKEGVSVEKEGGFLALGRRVVLSVFF